MLRSLFSGVSGLRSHQVAMDVESNNIANVNTIGYKYSRANFADLLAQTNTIATAPQGSTGGTNAVQVGLGTSINSMTRIHSQGSIQNSDKNTDVAIQGDGFFVVSADDGVSYKYTRSGDFKFDADGNFVDTNGYIVQGWTRDETTGRVDSTTPISNIKIEPGLTTPANSSTEINIKANLNSGSSVDQISAGIGTDIMQFMFDANGDAYNLVDATDTVTITTTVGGVVTPTTLTYGAGNDFSTFEELRADIATTLGVLDTDVTITAEGKLNVTGLAAGTTVAFTSSNQRLSDSLTALNGIYTDPTTQRNSGTINAAVHAASIDIYDSLGSKHAVKFDFRKISANEWHFDVTVPNPSTLTGASVATPNILNDPSQTIIFDSNGGLTAFNPTSIDFTGNNGSAAPQTVLLDFGTPGGGFDGIVSYDSASSTGGISQDGFAGGDLLGIGINQSGTLIGSFSNGRSFSLAQIGMSKFANNEGLVGDGGNVFLQSANSGDPIIGTAATSGRGFIQSSALEASNVDLSKSLTNLIIIQRGYQANGKTITTSDTLLETLIGLKR